MSNTTPDQAAPQDVVPHEKATQDGPSMMKKTNPATVSVKPPAILGLNLKLLRTLPMTLMPRIQSMIHMAQTTTMLQARISTT